MALLETLPTELHAHLAANGGPAPDTLLAAVTTDLTHDGQYGQEWVLLTSDRLCVYHLNGSPLKARLDLPLANLKDTRVDNLVGGCAMTAKVGEEDLELLRYTHARRDEFGRIAKFIGDVEGYRKKKAKGETPDTEPRLDTDDLEKKRCERCGLLLPEGTKVCPSCMNKLKVITRIFSYLKPHWGKTVVVWLTLIATTVMALIPPYLTKPLTDKVLIGDGTMNVDERIAMLGWLVGILAGAMVLRVVMDIIRGRVISDLGTSVTHELRQQVFHHIQVQSLKFFDKRQTGSIIARVTQDTQSLENVMMEVAQFILVQVLILFGVGGVLFYTNWQLALLVMLPVPLLIFFSRMFWPWVIRLWRSMLHYRSSMTALVNDSLTGVRVIKAFGQERQEIDRFDGSSNQVRAATRAAETMWVTFFPMLGMLVSSGALFVWYFGGRQVIQGNTPFSAGELLMFIAYLGMFYEPIRFLTQITNWIARALAAAERVFEVLDSSVAVKDDEKPQDLPMIQGAVTFENATFGYDKHKPVLKDINLDVKPGEMIGLCGQSGAGKSTTINLICRFYDLDEGTLKVDGVDIRRIGQEQLRNQIGVVLQDTFLFNGTVAENIAYAKSDATKEQIMAAAKAANAHEFIVKKPDGYDTKVGERGQKLSGGERQRISIARAILHDPAILILDEATSSVDTDTEKKIQEAIQRLVQGRTTFAIAHRLSTLRNADRLLVLKDGKVAEVGTHEELMKKKGEFHRLVTMQTEMSQIMELGG